MRRPALLMLLLSLAHGTFSVASADGDRAAVYGIWASSGTMIEVVPDGDALSARIVALKHPRWREKDGVGRIGELKTDIHNPDPALRDRPLIGVQLLRDFHFRGGRWRGKLYLPTSGSTWTASARVRHGMLEIRGFLGIPLFGRTQAFAPLAACNENILRMLEASAMHDTPCDGMLAGELGR
jgi:uncharacterized protein (DUF2147 family)